MRIRRGHEGSEVNFAATMMGLASLVSLKQLTNVLSRQRGAFRLQYFDAGFSVSQLGDELARPLVDGTANNNQSATTQKYNMPGISVT